MLESFVDLFVYFFDLIMHIDFYLEQMVSSYGYYVYLILFVIVFCETGLVITPFLPGDSLLFAGGALAGIGLLDYGLLTVVLLSSAIIGDYVNFRIGNYIGPQVFNKNYRFIKKEYLEQAHNFYNKHGGKAIVLARFIPIVRTFAPFVAGVANMHQSRFLLFNIIGAFVWVFSIVTIGYFFGNLPWVKSNFSFIIWAIILVSVSPVVIAWIKHKFSKNKI